ncbi:hypothetical protein GCM10007890_50410 [Methylobacterium tardum]|uniref:Uncharacterized protein n=1 Tax=Methylobacterium tardum TaxID=374432 RepID=A0AA37TFM1_9HYPH|nr:hypothetical protein GCM10007890_50410 [Methylobacterium tardum]
MYPMHIGAIHVASDANTDFISMIIEHRDDVIEYTMERALPRLSTTAIVMDFVGTIQSDLGAYDANLQQVCRSR